MTDEWADKWTDRWMDSWATCFFLFFTILILVQLRIRALGYGRVPGYDAFAHSFIQFPVMVGCTLLFVLFLLYLKPKL